MAARDIPPSRPARRQPSTDFFSSSAPLAQQSIATDLANDPSYEDTEDINNDGDTSPALRQTTSHQPSRGFSMGASYNRATFISSGGLRAAYMPAASQTPEASYITEQDRARVLEDECDLLRDNSIIPPKEPRRRSSMASALIPSLRRQSSTRQMNESALAEEDNSIRPEAVGERTALLDNEAGNGRPPAEDIDKKWENAVLGGMIHTTWRREAKVLGTYSRSLVVTFFLQYSLPTASVFAVGHLGKIELGASSLGSMTANITGYAVFQGLATSLDTLCAQAYGSGHKKLVGLQMQRMMLFLWVMIIPIGIIWLSAEKILSAIVPEKETAKLAGLYLKIALIGTPGYAAFEAGKRFVQAQGLFTANLYVLLIVAPLNAFLHWLLVWRLEMGFIGAPISIAISETLMPILLFLYVRFVAGSECWGGLSRDALRNWWPMIRLALPGLVMLLAEFLSFEILTLTSSWVSATDLAAMSILQSLCGMVWQFPFTLSVACSTRVANLIGATLADAAKTSARVAVVVAVVLGCMDMILLSSLRYYIPRLYTGAEDVIEITASVLPICAAFQLFDSIATCCNGILRGLGRQEFGGYVGLIAYYAVGLPISFGTCFGLGWGIHGLWFGPVISLFIVASVEALYIYKTSWEKSVEDSVRRNAGG